MIIVAATNSKNSFNYRLSKKIKESFEALDYLSFDEYADVDMFSNDLLSNNYFPEKILKIIKKLTFHKKIIFVSPEHNKNFSSFFKNILDWISIKDRLFFKGKIVWLISQSPNSSNERNQFSTISEYTFKVLGCSEFKWIGISILDEDAWNNLKTEISSWCK